MNALNELTVTSWWWVRHAPVTSHGGRLYGRSDVPANTENKEVFEGLAEKLPKGALWVASHLQRTHQTASAIFDAGHPTAEPLIEEDLAEQSFGDWQGLTYAEVAAERAGQDHPFWIAPADHAAPGGESFSQVVDRVSAAVARLCVDHAGRDIVAVAHGGSIRAALGHALGIAPAQALSFTIDNCSITRIDAFHRADGGLDWCVIGVNLPPSNGAPHGVVFPPRR
jgi:alpha-ribazole phosphatase